MLGLVVIVLGVMVNARVRVKEVQGTKRLSTKGLGYEISESRLTTIKLERFSITCDLLYARSGPRESQGPVLRAAVTSLS